MYEFIDAEENVQRSTLNVQRSILHSELDVGRWTLDVGRLLPPVNGPQDRRAFQRSLEHWYKRNGRDLPWRETRDPYAILVSEFMLQQTQVTTVLPYYKAWLLRFPTFERLAAASENDVLHAWQGLGYYARARNLHGAAKTISTKYGGRCPRSAADLQSLCGIGRYTANAVASFAFDQPVPVVDANIARLLARLFNISVPIDSPAGCHSIWNCASRLVGEDGAGVFNSALMDLGALVCLPRAPKCGICPVKKFCRATNPAILPIKKARRRTMKLNEQHLFTTKAGQILLQRSNKRWRGMWILPPLISPPKNECAIHVSTFPFTHHRITLQVFTGEPREIDNPAQRWLKIRALHSIPIPSPHRRAIDALLSARMRKELNIGR